jgi:hypothetical protein
MSLSKNVRDILCNNNKINALSFLGENGCSFTRNNETKDRKEKQMKLSSREYECTDSERRNIQIPDYVLRDIEAARKRPARKPAVTVTKKPFNDTAIRRMRLNIESIAM